MDFPNGPRRRQEAQRVFVHVASGEDNRALSCSIGILLQTLRSRLPGSTAAARQDAIDLWKVFTDKIDCCGRIVDVIECPVERHRQFRRRRQHGLENIKIQLSVTHESNDGAVHAEHGHRRKRALQPGDLGRAADREAVALAHHHAERQRRCGPQGANEVDRGCQTVTIDFANDLEPIRAAGFGGARIGHGLDDDFEKQCWGIRIGQNAANARELVNAVNGIGEREVSKPLRGFRLGHQF